ncbi:hypothetical protein HanPSC8_Chr08g0316821 [Helianthus annuus]|nr:hypothetical protein HanPSC8_Chr08g0316821 [Helianthus annuus]
MSCCCCKPEHRNWWSRMGHCRHLKNGSMDLKVYEICDDFLWRRLFLLFTEC